MKKTIKSLLAIAIGAFAFAACSDIPEPSGYSTTPAGQGGSGSGGTEIYTSGNLNTGWTLQSVTPDQPWIKGSKYAQATGYQDWDGTGKKNKAVEAWLVSPVISTAGYESVKISFDQTIKYTNNVQGWEQNHKVYASNNYDGSNISAAKWVELPFTPVASPYSDWTTYSSGEIQLPSEMAGKEKVYVAFYFKAPATNSTTWEVLNFKMMSGTASGGEGGGGSSDETLGTLDNPLTIDQALAEFDKLDDNGKTTIDAIVTGVVSRNITSADNFNQYKNINYYISVDGTENGKEIQVYKGMGLNNVAFTAVTDIKQGDQVIVRGKLYKYKNKNTGAIIPEIENGYLLKYTAGSGGGAETADQPKGDGSQGNPFNVAGAVAKCKEIGTTPSAQEFYVKGVAAAEATVTDATNKNITVDLVDNGYTQKFKAYRVIAADGKKLKMGYKIAKGATVIVYGKLVNYNENTPEISWTKDTYNGTLVSVNGQAPEVDDGQGGGGESGGGSGGGEVSGNTISVTTANMGWANNEKPTSLTLTDGTILTFVENGNANGPKYFTTGEALRLYPNNYITINAGSKTISAIEIVCGEYNGTIYNASGDITVNDTKMTVDGVNLKYTGPNASTATIKDISTTTGAPSQLRLVTLKITYAQ